jgi:hypothetical protein
MNATNNCDTANLTIRDNASPLTAHPQPSSKPHRPTGAEADPDENGPDYQFLAGEIFKKIRGRQK